MRKHGNRNMHMTRGATGEIVDLYRMICISSICKENKLKHCQKATATLSETAVGVYIKQNAAGKGD